MSVFVAGSLHLDVVVHAPRLPMRDETLVGDRVDYVCGGKGGNQAVAASRLGARTAIAGRVGDDLFAVTLLTNLSDNQVDATQVQRARGERSGMSVAIVERHGDYGAVIVSGANQAVAAEAMHVPDEARVVVLQNEIAESTNIAVAAMARRIGALVLWNAAPMRPRSPEMLALCDILVVNRVEAEQMLGRACSTPAEALVCAAAIAFPVALVITLGGDGLVWRQGSGAPAHLPGFAVEVQSTHGAGDVFVGALAARLDAGELLPDALRLSQAAAALHVASPLAERSRISPDSVSAFLSRNR